MVLEQAGRKLIHSVPKPKYSTGCTHADKCSVDDNKSCGGSKLIYRAICTECPPTDGANPQYIGTTGCTLHYRSSAHNKDIRGAKSTNSLHKHNKKFHQNSIKSTNRLKFHPISTHPKNLERMVTEAYHIHHSPNIFNSKSEFGQGKWISMNWNKQAT